MAELRARDVMVPIAVYPHALGHHPLAEGVRRLETSPIEFDGRISMPRILLVFDDASQLIGMVRRRDILRIGSRLIRANRSRLFGFRLRIRCVVGHPSDVFAVRHQLCSGNPFTKSYVQSCPMQRNCITVQSGVFT